MPESALAPSLHFELRSIAARSIRKHRPTGVGGEEQLDYSNGDVEMTIDNSSVQVLGIDAGGTMTDTFFVRADGRFVWRG